MHCDVPLTALGRGSLEWRRRAGVPSFERSATFFEKDSGQWGALAAFALHWPPSDKGRAPSSLTHRKLMCGP
jgi:hypothetical protein